MHGEYATQNANMQFTKVLRKKVFFPPLQIIYNNPKGKQTLSFVWEIRQIRHWPAVWSELLIIF